MLLNRDMIISYITNKDLDVFLWYRDMFSIPLKEDSEYITYDKDTKIAIFKGFKESVKLDDRDTPMLMSDTVILNKGDMGIVTETKEYLIGDLIINYLLSYRPFNKPILAFKEKLSYGPIENIIAEKLAIDISTDEYELFVECAGMLEQLSEILTVSSTEKSIRPAPGMREYKKKLYKEARELHGSDMDTDIRVIVSIDKALEEYDRAYMKDDPTYMVLANDKIMGNARKNMLGAIGAEVGIDGRITPIIENSLLDGIPAENDKIASLYNSSRKGSIFRGFMTQFTGADANVTIRVLNTVVIKTDDCKTSLTRNIKLSKDNFNEYLGYYIMVGGKPLLLTSDNINEYIGNTVSMRSYVYCLDRYCGICAGRQGEDNKNIAIILSTENNSIFTNTSMKAMHDKTLKLVDYDLRVALF